jgi:outer membrane lipoprotein-sorting protein
MKRLLLILLLAVTAASPEAGAADLPSATEVIRQIDRNMTFESRTMTITMTSVNPRRTREFTMVAFGRGETEAAIEYTAPAREAGTRMLRKGDELWMYMPSVEKTQKISGHMLRQGMMGTDVSYEDMMAAGDLESDYDAKITAVEDCGAEFAGRQCWKMEMNAKDPSITYPKRIAWIDTEYKIMARQELYAVSGMLLKKWTMSDVQKFDDGRYFPTKMVIADQLQQGTTTTLTFKDVKFGVDLQEEVFTMRWLERQ